jgi:hypothetical protein
MDDNGYVLRKGRPYFEIKQVPGHSQLVMDFICIIDREIEQQGTPGSIVEGSVKLEKNVFRLLDTCRFFEVWKFQIHIRSTSGSVDPDVLNIRNQLV